MKLYFLRHAEASYEAPSDHLRPLTVKGIDRMKTAGKVLKKLDLHLKHIYSSPRLRAKQTADIVAAALNLPVEVREEVNFDFDVEKLNKMTSGLSKNAHVMFVGHNPSLSEIINELTGANVDMKKGGLARVDVIDEERYELVWLIAPKVFDVLG